MQNFIYVEIILLFMEYYPRIIEEDLEQWINRREVVLIKGPRQSGKTTLFLHLNEKLNGNYVTLEDDEILTVFENNPKLFVKRFGDKKFLFIDEAQYSKNVGKIIKLIFDMYPNLKIFATGSGSFDVKVQIGKYLVGRAVYFELFPLNFEEFILWKDKSLHSIFKDYQNTVIDFVKGEKISISEKDISFIRDFKDLLEEYVIFGGFPAIVKEDDPDIKKQLLKNIYRTYLEKDVFFFFNIRHLEKFRAFLKYLSFTNGCLLELSKVSKDLGIDYKTLDNYLNILVNTYVISTVNPFHRNLVTELKKTRKFYFVDSGLRNAILGNFNSIEKRTDKGNLLENFIYNEIKKFGDIKYWRTTGKAEIDFILLYNDEIIPIEVKSFRDIERGFLSFLKTYKPKRALVFTEKNFGIKRVERTEILYLPHWFI